MGVNAKVQCFKSKFKKGDSVIVIAGSRRGHKGQIEKILDDGKCLVSGISIKKTVKPNPQRNIEGGIIDKPAPLNPSNLAIYNQVTQKPDRISYKILDDGRKVRVYTKTKEMINV